MHIDNYTGPGWSNGKSQDSVEFGDILPVDFTDSESRLHDSSYAHFKDKWHREAADLIYRDRLQDEKGVRGLIAQGPIYGNYTKDRASNLISRVSTGFKTAGPLGALLGAVYSQGEYISDMNYRLNSNGLAREKQDVLEYYSNDPLKSTHQYKKPKPETTTEKVAVPIRTDTMLNKLTGRTKKTVIVHDAPPTKKAPHATLPSIDEKHPLDRSQQSQKALNEYNKWYKKNRKNRVFIGSNFGELYQPLHKKTFNKNKVHISS